MALLLLSGCSYPISALPSLCQAEPVPRASCVISCHNDDMGLERISQILLPMHHSVQTLEGVMWPQLPRRHSSGLFLFALFPGVISGPEGGCTVMSVCKQGGECRQGSGGGDEGTSDSPKVGEGRKNLSSDKETQGKWQWSRRGGGGGGRRPPNPCKSFGKTAHRPPLIPPIKPALVCRCQGRAAVFRGALAPAGPGRPGSGGSL